MYVQHKLTGWSFTRCSEVIPSVSARCLKAVYTNFYVTINVIIQFGIKSQCSTDNHGEPTCGRGKHLENVVFFLFCWSACFPAASLLFVCLFHAVLKRLRAADFPFDHSSCRSELSITQLCSDRRGEEGRGGAAAKTRGSEDKPSRPPCRKQTSIGKCLSM